MIATGPCIVIIGNDADNCAVFKALYSTCDIDICETGDTTQGTWPHDYGVSWNDSVTGYGDITCSIEWADIPVKYNPTPKDFILLLQEQNRKYISAIASIFNIYVAVLCRRTMNSKSGFLARAGWKKKRQ